jgi:hypothetical protein
MEKLTTKLNLITMKIIMFFFSFMGQQHLRVRNQDMRRWMYFPCEIRGE